MRRKIVTAAALLCAASAVVLLDGSAAFAHTPNHELSCNGARLTGTGYTNAQTNEAAIYIDGVQVFHVADFGTSIDQTVPIPQDGVAHSVRFVIDAQGAGTEGHPEYDLDVTEEAGPCGEQPTTTTSAPTVTTLGSSTTTTVPPTVTTQGGGSSETSTTVPVANTPGELPKTGSTSTAPLWFAGVCIAIGLTLLAFRTRRQPRSS